MGYGVHISFLIYVCNGAEKVNSMKDTSNDMQAEMSAAAEDAAGFLRSLSNPSRLLLMCQLVEGQKSVGELENALGLGQAYVSQQLARLRAEGMVTATKDGRIVRYSIADERAVKLVNTLYELFCVPPQAS